MKLKEKIFAKEIVNAGRQPELDLGKAAMVVCLAFIHCIIECTPEEQLAYGIPFLFDSVIGGPASAPMYMFAMGAGMAYTRHSSPGEFVRRGIRIGIIGYLLNICRFLIPFLAGYLLTGDYDKYIEPLPYRVFGNDILQFAGLAMIAAAMFIRFGVPKWLMFAVCAAMSLAGTALRGVDVGNPAGNIMLGYLVGIEDKAGMVFSDFPILNWLIVPVSGYIFGWHLRYVKNKRLFYGLLSSAGILVTLVYFPIAIRNAWGMFGEGQNCYYHISTQDVAASLAFTVGMLGLYYMISGFLPGRVLAIAGEISRNINAVYCIHWVFVMACTDLFLYVWRGTQELSVPLTLLLGASISVVSIAIAHFWAGRGAQSKNKEDLR